MADKRISELTSATSLGDADVFPIVQSGETKKLTGSAVKSYAQSGVVLASEKGANSGVATLGSDGKLTASQLPDLAVSDYLGSVAAQSEMLALTGQKGDWCTRSDLGTTWVISGVNPASISSWTELNYPTAPVTSVAGKTGAVSLVKGDVGLGNVDNTSDANKPISSAAQTALDAKQAKVTASGLLKGDGNGGVTAAAAGTDYVAPSAVGATIVSQTGANGAAALPSGTTAQRPASPVAGNIRYNASTGKFEGYGSAWGNIGGGAAIGDAAPSNPGAGDLWWNSLDGHLYVYYSDVDTSQWVDAFAGGEGQYLPLTGGTISGNLAYTGTLTGGTGIINIGSGQIYKDASGNVGIGLTPVSGAGKVQISGAYNSAQLLLGPYGSRTYSYNTRANGSYDNAWLDLVSNSSVGGYTWQNGNGTLLTLDLNGVLQLDKGQLKFPATQNPSSDANTLDDYEEGTWTPTMVSGGWTLTIQSAKYIKIGKQVTVYGYVSLSGSGNSSPLCIGSLPFLSDSMGYYPGSADIGSGSIKGTYVRVEAGTQTVFFFAASENNSVLRTQLIGTQTAANYIIFSATYFTTA